MADDDELSVKISADNVLKVSGLRDVSAGGSYLNAATVTAVFKDRAGNQVSGQTWPLNLTYVPASNGNYEGNLSAALVLQEGREYFCEITATAGGFTGFWRPQVEAEYATS